MLHISHRDARGGDPIHERMMMQEDEMISCLVKAGDRVTMALMNDHHS